MSIVTHQSTRRCVLTGMLLAVLSFGVAPSSYADGHAISHVSVTKNIQMLVGRGGNVGSMNGPDGTFLIDDKFADLSESLLGAVKKSGGDVPKFLINTHYHGDHTGGNQSLGSAGSIILAHENVRKRLTTETFISAFGMRTPPRPKEALPVVTFTQDISLHLNGETINVYHQPAAHTDGDSFVVFSESNVIHTGDLFFNGFYPFIDVEHGGSLAGMVAAADRILSFANAETKIIPGHGPLANQVDLQNSREMLATVLARLQALRAEGKDIDGVIAAQPLADLEATWGGGFLNSEKWLQIIYPSVQ